MNKFHTILLDQASRTVLKNLTVFVKDDINQVKDYKGHFLKVSEGYDSALIKNAQVSCIIFVMYDMKRKIVHSIVCGI